MNELGLGIRLDTYKFTDTQMHSALDRLLTDDTLQQRLAAAAATIQARDGLNKAARLIEQAST
jgi:UDP:flavonoid glycosyltransferase YjiC (YdhE family)